MSENPRLELARSVGNYLAPMCRHLRKAQDVLTAVEARRMALDILDRAEKGRDAVAKREAQQGVQCDG